MARQPGHMMPRAALEKMMMMIDVGDDDDVDDDDNANIKASGPHDA